MAKELQRFGLTCTFGLAGLAGLAAAQLTYTAYQTRDKLAEGVKLHKRTIIS